MSELWSPYYFGCFDSHEKATVLLRLCNRIISKPNWLQALYELATNSELDCDQDELQLTRRARERAPQSWWHDFDPDGLLELFDYGPSTVGVSDDVDVKVPQEFRGHLDVYKIMVSLLASMENDPQNLIDLLEKASKLA